MALIDMVWLFLASSSAHSDFDNICCNISVPTLTGFTASLREFMLTHHGAVIAIAVQDEGPRATEVMKVALSDITPCGAVAAASASNNRLIQTAFMQSDRAARADAYVWAPCPKSNALCEPLHVISGADWQHVLRRVARDAVSAMMLSTETAEASQHSHAYYRQIRSRHRRGVLLPRALPPRPDGSRPIERLARVTPDALLSRLLWGIPLIVTDATHGWASLNWTWPHVR